MISIADDAVHKVQTTTFGAVLRTLRQDAGLSLRHIAHAAGISPTFLADVEKDRRMPARNVVTRLAAVLKVSPQRLLHHDPRESMADILAVANSDAETRTLLAQVCRGLGDGRVSKADLARIVAGPGRRRQPS